MSVYREFIFKNQPLSQEKRFTYGTHRSCSPEETLSRIRPLFEKVGLTRLADVTGLDRIGIPTVLSIRPNAASLSQFAGKGLTTQAAIVSASMECIETAAAEAAAPDQRLLPYRVLAEEHAVVPVDLLPLSRNSIFSENLPQNWSPAWDILRNSEVWIPTEIIPLEWFRYGQRGFNCFYQSSNGLASGNDLLEAVTSGTYELIERDAIACHCHAEANSSHRVPRVILGSIEYPCVLDLLSRLERAAVKAVLYDCTVDTQVPVYMATVYDRETRHIGLHRGFGAHLSSEIAMIRALTEAVQARAVYIAGSRDDLFKDGFTRFKQADNEAYIQRLTDIPETVSADRWGDRSTKSFEGDMTICADSLREIGIDRLLVVDLTPAGFPVAVARVVIPGLEGYMFLSDYAPGKRARAFLEEVPR